MIIKNAKELEISSLGKEKVEMNSQLKKLIVDYVGNSLSEQRLLKEDKDNAVPVTVEMIIEIFIKEFPEFLLVVAEENFLRGYNQAVADINQGKIDLDESKKYD